MKHLALGLALLVTSGSSSFADFLVKDADVNFTAVTGTAPGGTNVLFNEPGTNVNTPVSIFGNLQTSGFYLTAFGAGENIEIGGQGQSSVAAQDDTLTQLSLKPTNFDYFTSIFFNLDHTNVRGAGTDFLTTITVSYRQLMPANGGSASAQYTLNTKGLNGILVEADANFGITQVDFDVDTAGATISNVKQIRLNGANLFPPDNPDDPEIPEPSTYALMGTGIVALVIARRRRSARS